jgi:hypothetical protein
VGSRACCNVGVTWLTGVTNGAIGVGTDGLVKLTAVQAINPIIIVAQSQTIVIFLIEELIIKVDTVPGKG